MYEKKRRSERVPYPCEVRCSLGDGMEIANTRLSDVSTLGAFVESMNEIPVGTPVGLQFPVGEKTVTVQGRVVQQMPQFGFGVEFEKVSPDARTALADLVSRGH